MEQESLTDFIKIDGETCTNLIRRFSAGQNKDFSALRTSIVTAINDIKADSIAPQDILSANIKGRDRQHLKIRLSSKTRKVALIKSIKTARPENLFINDYLTKSRSGILFQLRTLRKSDPRVSSVYTLGGSVCCRLTNNDKVYHINSSAAYQQFTSNLK